MKITLNILFWMILLAGTCAQVHAQDNEWAVLKNSANGLFEQLSYHEAIDKYQRLIQHDSADEESLGKLAECYRLTNQMSQACDVYELIDRRGFQEPIQIFHYALALLETGNKARAADYMRRYRDDERGDNYLRGLANFDIFFRDSSSYHVNRASFNSELNDFSPVVLSGHIIFASSRDRAQWINYSHAWTGKAFYRLYSIRPAKRGQYTAPKKYAIYAMNRLNNGPVAFDPAGERMILTRNNMRGGRGIKSEDGQVKLVLIEFIYNAERNRWEKFRDFPFNSEAYNCAHAAFSTDGNTLYFSSNMPGTLGGMDLWICQREGNGWSKPVNAGSRVNTAGNEVFPTLFGDKLYYSSDGLVGMGGLDLYETRIGKKNLPEARPVNMGYPMNSSGDDFGLSLYGDGNRGFFSSNRHSMNENDDIYEVSIPVKPFRGIMLNGICRDKATGERLSGATVTLKDRLGKEIGRVETDDTGAYTFRIDFEKPYSILAQRVHYYDGHSNVEAVTYDVGLDVKAITELERNPETILAISVKDAQTMRLLRYATATRPVAPGDSLLAGADPNGIIRIPIAGTHIGDRLNVPVIFACADYFTTDTLYDFVVEAGGEIPLVQLMNRPMLGMDVGKMIRINPIYFDLNSANIRPDAAAELDKIVDIMKEYPGMVIELRSHTDCRATAAYNLQLSDRRAKSSAAYIISKGIGKNRIHGKGYGESELVNQCECEGTRSVPCTEEEHQMNRRTEFIIVKMK